MSYDDARLLFRDCDDTYYSEDIKTSRGARSHRQIAHRLDRSCDSTVYTCVRVYWRYVRLGRGIKSSSVTFYCRVAFMPATLYTSWDGKKKEGYYFTSITIRQASASANGYSVRHLLSASFLSFFFSPPQ